MSFGQEFTAIVFDFLYSFLQFYLMVQYTHSLGRLYTAQA